MGSVHGALLHLSSSANLRGWRGAGMLVVVSTGFVDLVRAGVGGGAVRLIVFL